MLTRHKVAQKLTDYLQNRIILSELVQWAEEAMMEEEFALDDFEVVRDIISRLGLADVSEFGLTWEDCEKFLARLGYEVRVEVLEVA
jgi:hypothetical protein